MKSTNSLQTMIALLAAFSLGACGELPQQNSTTAEDAGTPTDDFAFADENVSTPDRSLDGEASYADATSTPVDGAQGRYPDLEVILWTEYDRLITTDGLNGNLDLKRIQAAMKDLGATVLSRLVKSDQQYTSFKSFLSKVAGTNIKVWAMLPRRCKSKKLTAFGDCPTAAAELAKLSLTYPNLTAMRLDDLAPTVDSIVTKPWFEQILAAKNKVNPAFKVIPVMYLDVRHELQMCTSPGSAKATPLQGDFYDVFKDGLTLPYWASFRGASHVDTQELTSLLELAGDELPPIPFFTTIYPMANGAANKLPRDPSKMFHSPAVLEQMLDIAASRSKGVGMFWFPLYMYDTKHLLQATIFQQQSNDDPDYAFKLTNSGKVVTSSWFQAIEADVPPGDISVTFDVMDRASTGVECDWMFKQVLIDGRVVWQEDVCTGKSDSKVTLAKVNAKATTKKSAKVAVRIYAPKANGMPVRMYVSEPVVSFNGNEQAAKWKFHSSMVHLNDYKKMYDTVKSVLRK